MSSGGPALEPLRIKRATLWARVELKHAHHYHQHHRHNQINQRNITLWVFRVHCGNTTHLRGKVIRPVIDSSARLFDRALVHRTLPNRATFDSADFPRLRQTVQRKILESRLSPGSIKLAIAIKSIYRTRDFALRLFYSTIRRFHLISTSEIESKGKL